MTMIFTTLGWLAALVCAAAAGERAWSMRSGVRDAGNWVVLLAWSALAVVMFTFLGVIGPLAGALYATLAVAVVLAVGRAWTPEGRRALAGDLRYGFAEPFSVLRGRLGGGETAKPEASSPEAAVAEAAATRTIPSVLEDPALGMAPEPAELVSGHAQAPAPWAALAQFIAGFEPEDDMSLRMFMEGNAAGSVMVADAWHQFADTCLNSVGLDPAFVAGILEAGDSAGAHGSLLAQVIKRLSVIYGAGQEWVAAHGPLPKNAREWLTGNQ
jgi:hypothetical protein